MLSPLRRVVSPPGLSYLRYRTMSSIPPEFKQFRLALIQLASPSHATENPTEADIKHANLNHAREMINRAVKNANEKPDLVVLPVRSSSSHSTFLRCHDKPRNASTHPMAMCTSLCTPRLLAIRQVKNMTSQKLGVRASEHSRKQRRKTGFGSLEVLVYLGDSTIPLNDEPGSIPERDANDGKIYNTCIVFSPEGRS